MLRATPPGLSAALAGLEQALGRDDAAATLAQAQIVRSALHSHSLRRAPVTPYQQAQAALLLGRVLRRVQTRAAAAQQLLELLLPQPTGPALYGPDGQTQASRPVRSAVA